MSSPRSSIAARPRTSTRIRAALFSLVLVAGAAACSSDDGDGPAPEEIDDVSVAEDAAGSGVEASEALFSSSRLVVVTTDDPADQAIAATAGVALAAPVLTAGTGGEDSDDGALADEISRLGAQQVLVAGSPELDTDVETVELPRDAEAMTELSGVEFAAERQISDWEVPFVSAHLDREELAFVTVADGEDADGEGGAEAGGAGGASVEPQEPIHSGDERAQVLVTNETPVAAIATAVASGAQVTHLAAADPRVSGEAVAAAKAPGALLALGPGWEDFDERVELAQTVPELPFGGQLLFPGHRFIAAYGSPITPALGVLGENDPDAAVEYVEGLVSQYQSLAGEKVVPAFEIIGTVAAQEPGPDGNYTNEWDPAIFEPMIDAITEAGGYAVIDLQPGKARFLDQAKPFEYLLRRPGVGLALDPEWKLSDGQQPLQQVGSVGADEVNEVADWLAEITRDEGGPQKMLMLHQFQVQMLRDRDQIDTSHDELAIVLHADGHGTPDLKMGTWDVLRNGLSEDIWLGWKNFIDEDTPTFTPAETYDVRPRPWFVSYQ